MTFNVTKSDVCSSSQKEDRKNKLFKQKNPLQEPLFPPDSSWTPPELLPDISDAKEIAVDLETWDPNLKSKGAGWCRGDGHVVGVAVAVEGWSGYLPIRHRAGGNLDENVVFNWLKKMLNTDAKKI